METQTMEQRRGGKKRMVLAGWGIGLAGLLLGGQVVTLSTKSGREAAGLLFASEEEEYTLGRQLLVDEGAKRFLKENF